MSDDTPQTTPERDCDGMIRDDPEEMPPSTADQGALALARWLALNGGSFYDAILNVDGKNGREQWSIRMQRIKP